MGVWDRYYMRAKVPDWDEEDISAMDVEERLASSTDGPLDVYHKLQSLIPSADDLVVPAWHAEGGCVRLRSRQDLDAMPAPVRWALREEVREGAIAAVHCRSRSVGSAWGAKAPTEPAACVQPTR